MNAKELFQAGQLDGAISATIEEVKKHPTDLGMRGFLCELLCFAGDLQRVDKQLDTMGHQEPQVAVQVALFRQLVRAEQARGQFFAEGRLPEFVAAAAEQVQHYLEASIRIREGLGGEALELLEEAERLRPAVSGVCNGEAFQDMRDIDDATGGFFEVLTSTGKYYWIPAETVELMEFRPPEQPRDLLWRRTRMIVRGGPDGEVFLPALYHGSDGESEDRFRLGRYTDWRGGDGAPVRGIGLRMFLVGDEARSIMELEEIRFNAAETAAGESPHPQTTE